MSVKLRGTAGPTPMVSAPVLPTVQTADGASDLATDTPTILITTLGGGPWDITDVVGIHTTDGARGAALRWPMSTESGAIPPTRELARLGPIPTRAITALRRAELITIHKPAGAPSLAAATTPISTPGIPTDTAVGPPTTRTRALWRVVEPAM